MSATEMLAGAAPGRKPDWHSIEWKKVWCMVRRLQARIVKAVAQGRWNKVKAFCESSVIRVRKLPVWTESSGTHRKPSRLLSTPCVGTVINRNRSAGCTFPKATANGAVSGFPR